MVVLGNTNTCYIAWISNVTADVRWLLIKDITHCDDLAHTSARKSKIRSCLNYLTACKKIPNKVRMDTSAPIVDIMSSLLLNIVSVVYLYYIVYFKLSSGDAENGAKTAKASSTKKASLEKVEKVRKAKKQSNKHAEQGIFGCVFCLTRIWTVAFYHLHTSTRVTTVFADDNSEDEADDSFESKTWKCPKVKRYFCIFCIYVMYISITSLKFFGCGVCFVDKEARLRHRDAEKACQRLPRAASQLTCRNVEILKQR